MLQQVNPIVGGAVVSSEGPLGSVDDILFDNRNWTFRYLVVDVGHWLAGRLVLLSFEIIEPIDESRHEIRVPLTKRAIELSPDVSTKNPVSMEAELLLGKYWQWTIPSVTRLPSEVGRSISQEATLREKRKAESEVKSHLQSVREITGYRIEASDGEIGHLTDLVMDDSTREIRYLVVDAGHWLSQRTVLIPRLSLETIRWADRKVHVAIRKDEIRGSPVYDPKQPITQDHEQALIDYYRLKP